MDTLTINKEVFISAPTETVFDALTSSEEIVKYFPIKEVVSNWKVGSEVLYKGEIDGREFTDYGQIEILSRPAAYKYIYWSTNHGTERTVENYLTIEYSLEKEKNGTRLRMKQSNIKSDEMFQLMDKVIWNNLLDRMRVYIESCT